MNHPESRRCAICSSPGAESILTFSHGRKNVDVWLFVPLCEACGSRLEKHLRRAVPKRLFELS